MRERDCLNNEALLMKKTEEVYLSMARSFAIPEPSDPLGVLAAAGWSDLPPALACQWSELMGKTLQFLSQQRLRNKIEGLKEDLEIYEKRMADYIRFNPPFYRESEPGKEKGRLIQRTIDLIKADLEGKQKELEEYEREDRIRDEGKPAD